MYIIDRQTILNAAIDPISVLRWIRHIPLSDQRTSLFDYLTVIIYSALLAIFYLLVNPDTRLWRQPQPILDAPKVSF